jgi:hypothetical protein
LKLRVMRGLKIILPVLLVLAMDGPIAQSATGPFGANLNTGYFSGTGYAGTGWAFVPFGSSAWTNVTGLGPGSDNLADFETEFQNRLNDPTSVVDQGRAAAEIDIMLGQTGPSFGGSIANGIAYAQANFNNWKNLMALYDSGTVPGYSVQWNVSFNLGSLSGEWVATGAKGVNDSNWGSCSAFEACAGDLVIQSPDADNSVENVVRFNVNGQVWVIPVGCACMTGTATSLAIPGSPSYNMNLFATGTSPTVVPGGTGTINLSLDSTGANPVQPGFLEVQWPGATDVVEPCGANCSDPNQLPLTFGETARGYTHSGVPGITGPDWYWHTGPYPPGQFGSSAMTFSVPSTATPGDTITFQVRFFPYDPAGDIKTVTVTFIVLGTKSPSVVGLNSDIHAGGGKCEGPVDADLNPDGSVITNPGADSYGNYAVSGSGGISGIGSNNSPSNSSLRLGNTGNYASLCRPDLYTNAKDSKPTGANTIAGGTYDVGSAFNSGPNVNFVGTKAVAFIAGNVVLHGTYSANRPLTLVVDGTVTIDNNIAVTGGTSGNDLLPSIAILASGPINILSSATAVRAMLFSDADIDTCYLPAPCNNTLTVVGFAMAPTILLHRLGP